MLLRIANLARGNRRANRTGVEEIRSGEGVKQQQHRLREGAGCRTRAQSKRMRIKKEKANRNESEHRQQLADGE